MRDDALHFGPWRVERPFARDLGGIYYLARRDEPGSAANSAANSGERATVYALSSHLRLPERGRRAALDELIAAHLRLGPAFVRFHGVVAVDDRDDDLVLVADPLDEALSTLRTGRRPSAGEIRETGAALAGALADAHADDVFHGALDLDNVLWAPGHTPRILGAGVTTLGVADRGALTHGDVAALGRLLCALVAGWQPRGGPAETAADAATQELVRLLADPGAGLTMAEAHVLLRGSEPTRLSMPASDTPGSDETRRDVRRGKRPSAAAEAGTAAATHAGDVDEPDPSQSTSDRPGGHLGRYRIVGQLGRGGMGEVFLAEDPALRRSVAIKRIRPDLERDRTFRARLRREAQLAAKLSHRAIVQVFDLVTEGKADHVVMEYVPGPSLHAVLASGPLPPAEVVRIGREVADGLAHAHAAGIVHRDLKLENVLFTADGQPKIADFGIARSSVRSAAEPRGAETLTREGFVVGTSRSMSPEQIQGLEVDARSDLFSLGVMLYELLTGVSPFAAEVDAQTILRVMHHRQRPVREVAPAVPAALSDLVDRLLEKEPPRRPHSAREVQDALVRLDEQPGPPPAARTTPSGATSSLRAVRSGATPATPAPAPPAPATPAPAPASAATTASSRGERRQVTLACLDLLADPDAPDDDPEPLAEVLPLFRARVDELMKKLDGSLVSVLGHRLVICFGYPHPLEDAARRAVLAARSLLDTAASVRAADPAHAAVSFTARAAVHTGLAVVRQGRTAVEDLVLGATLDAALRLLQLGGPGDLWVSGATARLIETEFRLETPPKLPDGVSSAHRVVGASPAPSPGHGEHDRPLIARDQELQLLLHGWRRARGGDGQVVLLVGDPGIGKSRMVRELQRSVASDGPRVALARGTAHQQRSALEPAADMVAALIGLTTADGSGERATPDIATDRVRHLTAGPDEAAQVLQLLGLPATPAPVPPDRARQQLLGGLRDVVLRIADETPLLIAVEDLHWLDPSTLDLLALLVQDVPSSPAFLIMTTRPGFQPPWPSSSVVTQLHLSRLDAAAVEAVIAQASRGRELAPRERALIAARCEGVPLYAEELVRAALDVGTSAMVPSTLRDALAARLHQLGPVTTRVANVAAVSGREFTADLIAGAGSIERTSVDRELDRLVGAEILFRRRGKQRETLFVFRHVLLQQSAYEELLAADRRDLHGRVADELAAAEKAGTGPGPEIIAHHLASARRFEEAIASASAAAARALTRHAMVEAIELFRQALTWLEQLPASSARDRHEILLRMQLGALLIGTAGYTSAELERSCARAESLCAGLDDVALPIKYGLWAVRLMRGGTDIEPLIGWFERVVADEKSDPIEKMMAHAALGTHGYLSASYRQSLHHLREAMERFDADSHARVVQTYGGCGGFYGHLHTTGVLWVTGRGDEAWRHKESMIELARSLSDPYTMATAEAYDLVHGFSVGDPDRAEAAADRLQALADRYGFPYLACTAHIGRGWALAQRGQFDRGLRELEAGLGGKRMMGVRAFHPHYVAYYIEAALKARRVDEGLAAVDEALGICRSSVDTYYEPEILRLGGELWRLRGDAARARADFEMALALAERDGALALALRAATSLADVLHDQGSDEVAAAVLRPVSSRFPEDTGGRDIDTARRLLRELPA